MYSLEVLELGDITLDCSVGALDRETTCDGLLELLVGNISVVCALNAPNDGDMTFDSPFEILAE